MTLVLRTQSRTVPCKEAKLFRVLLVCLQVLGVRKKLLCFFVPCAPGMELPARSAFAAEAWGRDFRDSRADSGSMLWCPFLQKPSACLRALERFKDKEQEVLLQVKSLQK